MKLNTVAPILYASVFLFAPNTVLGQSRLQLGSDIDGQNENQKSGQRVILSGDGRRVAVGEGGVGEIRHLR